MTVGTFTSPLTPRARSVSCAAWPAGLLIAGWPGRDVQSFDGTTFHACAVPGDTAVVSGHGYIGAAVDQAGNGWVLSSEGTLDTAVLSGTPATTLLPQSTAPGSSLIYVGLAAIGANIYALEGASGRLFSTTSGGGVHELQSFGGRSTTLAASASGTLWALQPDSAQAVGFNPASGTTQSITVPITHPSALAASGSALAVSGNTPVTYAGTASGFAATTANGVSTFAVSSPEGGTVTTYAGSDPVWTATGVATGLSAPGSVCWTPDGEQILVGCSTGLTVLQLELGVPTQVQSFGVAAPGAIAVTPDGQEALVCQPAANTILPFSASVGIWTEGAAVSVPAPQGLMIQSSILAIVMSGQNLINLVRTGSTWVVGPTIATLPFVIADIQTMPDGTVCAIGNLGGTAYVATLTSQYSVIKQTAWTGSADALTMLEGQIFVLDRTMGLVRSFGLINGTPTLQGRRAAASVRGFGSTSLSKWFCGTSLQQMQPTAPFRLSTPRVGQVSVWTGSWFSYVLGIGHEPSCLAFDPTGSLWVVTRENDVLNLSLTSGALSVESSGTLPLPPGQEAGTPLGASALAWISGHLYAVTSASGTVLEIA